MLLGLRARFCPSRCYELAVYRLPSHPSFILANDGHTQHRAHILARTPPPSPLRIGRDLGLARLQGYDGLNTHIQNVRDLHSRV